MQEKNIKTLSMGCRLNALESEKIAKILKNICNDAILVNTCAVTGEAERQSGQILRKLHRENPDIPIFVTGCAATRNPVLFSDIENVFVISNSEKLNQQSYIKHITNIPDTNNNTIITDFVADSELSKKYIQIQNGCNHKCAYCVTRLLRGPSYSFPYDEILSDVKDAVTNGFYEIVLTGVDSASYVTHIDNQIYYLSDLCKKLLTDVPEIQRLRLSSVDPASPEIYKIIDLIATNPKMMPHLHLSVQSGSDTILRYMHRRHSSDTIRKIVQYAKNKYNISFSWDIICGFPGESDELFNETLTLIQDTKPVKIHAFPFSARPDTEAYSMNNQINRQIAKQRVKVITNLTSKYEHDFLATFIGQTEQILMENSNIGRTRHDIPIKINGNIIPQKTICNIKITDVSDNILIGEQI